MYDKSRTTARLCIVALGVAWFVVCGCLFSAILILKDRSTFGFYLVPLSNTTADLSSFFINIFIALLTDALGFIHGTSLRRVLYQEKRLLFNTNLHQFNSARNSAPNRWPSNILCAICLIICYAATSQLFVVIVDAYVNVYVNGIAIAVLRFGLMGQAAIGTWCIFSTIRNTPIWSSNPLHNCLILLHGGGLKPTSGYSMLPVSQQSIGFASKKPCRAQIRLLVAHSSVEAHFEVYLGFSNSCDFLGSGDTCRVLEHKRQ